MDTDNIYKPGDFKAEAPTSIHLVHKNGKHRIVSLGFCWFGCLLPPLWTLSEGLWRPFAGSLLFFLAIKLDEAAVITCQQSEFCAALPYIGLLKGACFFGYVFTMAYFGFDGKKMLIADLLKHGYFVEGTPRPVESDEYES
jgi:hypothetical protein